MHFCHAFLETCFDRIIYIKLVLDFVLQVFGKGSNLSISDSSELHMKTWNDMTYPIKHTSQIFLVNLAVQKNSLFISTWKSCCPNADIEVKLFINLQGHKFAMSFRRAIWVEDQSVLTCTKCRMEFNMVCPKHHCRKCGLVFCHDCTRNKCIIPQDELVPRPPNWMSSIPAVVSNEDNFRCPQRVCDTCFHLLRDIQGELRQSVSR